MSNYGESYYLEELEEMQKEKVVTIIPDKQIIIDKSDLDFVYKQKADLEAKLAESELKVIDLRVKQLQKDAKKYKNADKQLLNENITLKDGVRELKQQLARTQNELSAKVEYIHELVEVKDDYKQQLAEKEKLLRKYAATSCPIHQDKISFAVEKLEKLKELLNTDFESTISWIDPYEDGEYLNSMKYHHNNTIEIIDNQIKQLKEGEVV